MMSPQQSVSTMKRVTAVFPQKPDTTSIKSSACDRERAAATFSGGGFPKVV